MAYNVTEYKKVLLYDCSFYVLALALFIAIFCG